VDLMAHRVPWNDAKVKSVFSTWAELLPYHQPDALGRTWQEAAAGLQNKKSGMYVVGLFVTEQMTANLNDVDFFTFPEVDPAIGSDALDAPIDGYMMSARPKDTDRAKALLTFFGSKAGGDLLVKNEPTTLVANSQADVSGYTKLQNKAADVVLNAKNIAQFLDRDTRPDFASTVMIPALQSFLKSPKEIDGLCTGLERQARTIFDS
jgi:multiple sugar transport system substrate-binding protein